MLLSVVIPARNEVDALPKTLHQLYSVLKSERIPHELVVVNDNSSDSSELMLKRLKRRFETLKIIDRKSHPGFGLSVRDGLAHAKGEAVAIFMADGSDDVSDLVSFYYHLRNSDLDCVFGTRFSQGGKTYDYPWAKYILNRIFNLAVSRIFRIPYNDLTNAFKVYRRSAIELAAPLVSHHFNLCIELPLKTIIRGGRYAILPNTWTNRKTGISKLKIKEMGSRYLYIVFSCYLEKRLSRGDYERIETPTKTRKGDSRKIYQYRFRKTPESVRQKVWQEIAQFIFTRTGRPDIVLDPAAGSCEFINAVPSTTRWAVDLSNEVKRKAASKVTAKVGNALQTPLPSNYFDMVFISNFLEHLKDAKQISRLLQRMEATLKENGRIVIMGPNFRHCYRSYFDFADHHLPLTERSVEELLVNAEFEIEKIYPRFLPFSFTGKLPTYAWLTRLYLHFPFAWRIFGKQFLLIARKRTQVATARREAL